MSGTGMIEVRDLSLSVGTFTLSGVNFTVPQGQYAILMGRTGCGKTSLLEAICGLRRVTAGRIQLMGTDVTQRKPNERGVGFVPQDLALFETMTVREHLGFALTIRDWSDAEIKTRVAELADMLGIAPLLDRLPQGLSGGESQRVALGRALAARPGVLCLDEPLSAVDDETREEMYGVLRDVQKRTGVTTLHVTHNRGEATALADCLFVLKNGQVTVEPSKLQR
jgi:molybdate/tungstate transport system ATP-binding protein